MKTLSLEGKLLSTLIHSDQTEKTVFDEHDARIFLIYHIQRTQKNYKAEDPPSVVIKQTRSTRNILSSQRINVEDHKPGTKGRLVNMRVCQVSKGANLQGHCRPSCADKSIHKLRSSRLGRRSPAPGSNQLCRCLHHLSTEHTQHPNSPQTEIAITRPKVIQI